MTRVLVIAPSAVVRAGLEALLASNPALQVVGSAPTLGDLAGGLEGLNPDVLLVEAASDHGNLALPVSAEAAGSLPVVLLAAGTDEAQVAEALRRGVRAILPRDASPEEIAAAVGAAGAGLIALHPEAAAAITPLLSSAIPRPAPDVPVEELTPREIEVLGLLAEGAGNKQIARRLEISEHTVKFHVGSILSKLGAASRTEAVTLGVRRGIILL